MAVALNASVLNRLRPGRFFEDVAVKEEKKTSFSLSSDLPLLISALEYHESGTMLFAASQQEDLLIAVNALEAEIKSVHKMAQTGIGLLQPSHHASALLHTTVRLEDTVRYLSIEENKYIAAFRGHKRKIVSLELSPLDDTFMTGAIDDAVMLWDLREPSPIATIPMVAGAPFVGYDPQGIVFGVALPQSHSMRLYDARAWERGPFSTWEIPFSSAVSRIKFSNDGNYILISGISTIFSISAWDGSFRSSYLFPENNAKNNFSQSFISPDAQFVYAPTGDNRIAFWESNTGKGVVLLETPHRMPISAVAMNPKHASMATACASLALWTLP